MIQSRYTSEDDINHSFPEKIFVITKDKDKQTTGSDLNRFFSSNKVTGLPPTRNIKRSRYIPLKFPNSRKELNADEYDKFPYSTIASLTMISSTSSSKYNGNGVFVGPFHILTSRKNIIDRSSKPYSKILVAAGLRSQQALFGIAEVIAIRTFDTYDDNPDLDLALLIIDKPLGKATGWMGMYAFKEDIDLSKLLVCCAGYHGMLNTMYYEYGKVRANGEILEHNLYMENGSIGSPIWFKNSSNECLIVGIHIENKEACRLSLSKLEALVEKANSSHKMLKFGEDIRPYLQLREDEFVIIFII